MISRSAEEAGLPEDDEKKWGMGAAVFETAESIPPHPKVYARTGYPKGNIFLKIQLS